jgi:hypothetical protein
MAFTLAHPAAIMPLRRFRYLPTLALLVGSIVPDVPYYLPNRGVPLNLPDLHTLFGAIVGGIPLGMLILALALLLRRPLTALMTESARWLSLREAEAFLSRPLNWLLAIPAVLIGSLTHILWDGFTHTNTWITSQVSVLNIQVDLFGLYTGPVCHILQYVTTVLGLLLLWYWYHLVAAEAPPAVSAGLKCRRVRRALLLVIAGAVAMGIVHTVRAYNKFPTVYGVCYLMLTRTTAWFMLLYVVAGAMLLRTRRAPAQLES